jgi:Bacteriophage probable baseplate hub protein
MAGNDQHTLRTARPTINLDGQDSSSLSEGLLRMSIVEHTEGLYRCEAHFGNWGPKDGSSDFLYFDRRTIDFGKTLKIKYGGNVLFEGKITALEAHFPEGTQPELAVLAEDRFQDLRMTRRTRSFSDKSDSDLFNQIANDYGLTPSVNLTGGSHKFLTQVNQSDLAFLRERARAIGAEIWMDGSTLYAKQRTARATATTQLGYRNELHSFTVLADLAHQRTAVVASGWDVSSKEAIKYEATDSAISNELSGDTSGSSILQQALGQRKDSLAHSVPLETQEAQARAEAHFRLLARRFVVGHGVADTQSDLRVGNLVDLSGLGPLFNGRYYLTEVVHLFDDIDGLRTEITTERAGLGQAQ